MMLMQNLSLRTFLEVTSQAESLMPEISGCIREGFSQIIPVLQTMRSNTVEFSYTISPDLCLIALSLTSIIDLP